MYSRKNAQRDDHNAQSYYDKVRRYYRKHARVWPLGIFSFFLLFAFLSLRVHTMIMNSWEYYTWGFPLEQHLSKRRKAHLPIKMQLEGIVISSDEDEKRIAGALVTVKGFENLTKVAQTSEDGRFTLSNVPTAHLVIIVTANGYRTEIIHFSGDVDGGKSVVEVDPIILLHHNPKAVRMLFGGDMQFGRKWIDPHNFLPSAKSEIPKDDPNALILPSDPEPGTRRAIRCLKPWFQEADFCSINLETPILSDPSTPNKNKVVTFFSLPGSLKALKWLGVDYVTLGNNHIYDYMQRGLESTLKNLDEVDIGWSGAGLNATHASASYRTTLSEKGTKYSFLSLTNIKNLRASTGKYATLATRNRAGAANINNNGLENALTKDQKDGFIPIPQLHVGVEYSFEPTVLTQEYMQTATDFGVPLVVQHHAHVAHGIGVLKPDKKEIERKDGKSAQHTVHIMSLGNLAMDSLNLEPLLTYIARVDMSEDGTEVERLNILPLYIEHYAPKPIGGLLASRVVRLISQRSHPYISDLDGETPLLYPYNGIGHMYLGKGRDGMVKETRSIVTVITVPPSKFKTKKKRLGSTVVDLREWLQIDESLLSWSFASASTRNYKASAQTGWDLFGFGDFEDYIVDNYEERSARDAINARWDLAEHGQPCKDYAYRGSVSLGSSISAKNANVSEIVNRERIRVVGAQTWYPQKDLTLIGYAMGKDAGNIAIKTKYHAAALEASRTFGEEVAFEHNGGTFGWTAFVRDLNIPRDDVNKDEERSPNYKNARSFHISIHHSIPVSRKSFRKRESFAAFDELAVISWDKDILGPGELLKAPNARDFLKIKGPPGTYKLKLTFVRYIPAVASDLLSE